MTLTYRDFNRRANQMARYLIEQGIRSGDRIGLLFDKSPETYIAMLAVMKVNAAYVPLDAAFPIERMRFIIGDAEIAAIVSVSSYAERLSSLDVKKIFVDADKRAIDAKDAEPLTEVAPPIEPLCYIIYTSGTTGNPKGVGIGHASICNFVRVAAELYGYLPSDRIYQGMTIAFDFSIEEIWVPLMAGATLVPARPGTTMMSDELGDFLRDRNVTVMACCPTLLATIEQDLPKLRLLLVGGEACPQNLVVRWYRPGRRILNSYGPTEATVTATLTELTPDKPVTIGIPLSTYSIVILDPLEDKTVPTGELGEVGIAGIGLALGYMNRDELTMKKFIRDFLQIENNTSGRIYRTGDLGRIDENGEIDYRGRIDTQVKIRGYRIELTEIEQVLLDLPEIAQAAVTTFEPEEGLVEIVAYYAFKHGMEAPRDQISGAAHEIAGLHGAGIPRAARRHSDDAQQQGGPQEAAEAAAAALLRGARLRSAEDRHRAHAARRARRGFAARSRFHRAQFLRRSRRQLAADGALLRGDPQKSRHGERVDARHLPEPDARRTGRPPRLVDRKRGGDDARAVPHAVAAFVLPLRRGAARLLCALRAVRPLYPRCRLSLGGRTGSRVEIFGRSVVFAAASFVVFTGASIVAKWLLIGRFKPTSIPIWSFGYFRFWIVLTMMRTSPITVFYRHADLQRLSASDGREDRTQRDDQLHASADLRRHDLDRRQHGPAQGFDRSRLPRAVELHPHRPGEVGSNAFVGEASVLDIDTVMGDGTQLGHASSLQSGQRVPDGKRYHGSPAD